MSPAVLAHLAPGYQASGFSPGLVIYLTVAGLVVMALALRVSWATPRFGALAGDDPAGPVAPIPDDSTASPTEPGAWPGERLPGAVRIGLRAVGLFGLAFLLLCGWAGSPQIGVNLLWIAMFSEFWIGGQLLSLLIGDWWRLIDPFDTIAGWIAPGPTTGDADEPTTGDADDEHGDWWVPAALLFSFAWMWLAWEGGRATIRPNATWLTLYLVVMVAGAALGGRGWVRRNEAFAVTFGLVASISPVDWSGQRPHVRNPLGRNAEHRVTKREAAVLAVLAGTVLFDALGSTRWWADFVGTRSINELTAFSTGGMVWLMISAGVVWIAAARLATWAAGTERGVDSWALAGPLAGTVAGFAVAHEINSLLTNSQSFLALLSDPLAKGWDLIGTIRIVTNPYLLSAGAQAWVSLALIEVAVLVSYLGLHDRCVARFGAAGTRATWAALGFMLVAAVVGLKLLVGV